MKNLLLIHYCFLAIFYSANAQISKERILKTDSLKYKSVQILIRVPSSEFPFSTSKLRGTGFFVKYKKNYFFITNYHVVTGRAWEDTSFFVNKVINSEFGHMTVSVYSKNKEGYEDVTMLLLDSDGNRLYSSIPVDKETRRVDIDIACIKLDSLPGQTVIYPIDLDKIDNRWSIGISTPLYSYGYSKKTWEDLYPFCDTIYSVGDTSFNYKDKYILVYKPADMHGSSGSPVYLKEKRKLHFVGIFFAQINPEYSQLYPDIFMRNYYANPIGVIITVNYLSRYLDFLLSGSAKVSKSP